LLIRRLVPAELAYKSTRSRRLMRNSSAPAGGSSRRKNGTTRRRVTSTFLPCISPRKRWQLPSSLRQRTAVRSTVSHPACLLSRRHLRHTCMGQQADTHTWQSRVARWRGALSPVRTAADPGSVRRRAPTRPQTMGATGTPNPQSGSVARPQQTAHPGPTAARQGSSHCTGYPGVAGPSRQKAELGCTHGSAGVSLESRFTSSPHPSHNFARFASQTNRETEQVESSVPG